MSKIRSNEFLEMTVEQVPRLLGQLNRNPSSHSYGSFDRAYWHYRTNDISSSRYQEAVYTLSLLYCFDFEGNDYYHDEKLLEWIRASLRFTTSLQRRNGSFDEWYINEGSYVATAFLTAALGETILLFRLNGIILLEEQLISNHLERAAMFLMKNKEETALNQVSGAIFAIACAGRVCNREEFFAFADGLLADFLSQQTPEGWWREYGGPDIGYLSLTINYLEKYIKLTGSKVASSHIMNAKLFVLAFINPDQTAGGEHMSRNTEYIIPSGALPYLGAINPACFDDRYLCYILYNWLEVGLQTTPQKIKLTLGEDYFPESSLLRVSNKHYFFIANGKKGGVFRLYSRGGVYYDSGLEITLPRENLTTGVLDSTNKISFLEGNFSIFGSLKKIEEPLLKTKKAIIFKFWQLLFGRIGFLQKIIKEFLRFRMISYSSKTKLSFERSFQYNTTSVIVTDIIRGGVSKKNITMGVKAAYTAVPSSKYASVHENSRHLLPFDLEEKEQNDICVIKRTFILD